MIANNSIAMEDKKATDPEVEKTDLSASGKVEEYSYRKREHSKPKSPVLSRLFRVYFRSMDQNDKNKEVQLRGKCVTRSMMVLEFKPNLRKFCSILHVVLLLHPKTTICDGFGID